MKTLFSAGIVATKLFIYLGYDKVEIGFSVQAKKPNLPRLLAY